MFKSIWDNIINYFREGGMVARLMLINIAVFIGVSILGLFMGQSLGPNFNDFIHFFCVSSNLKYLALHPWGLFTSMFLHEGFQHIFFNMIWLYVFGNFAEKLLGERRVLPLYVLGGLTGAFAFVLANQLLGVLVVASPANFALGASSAVMALTVAVGAMAPDYRISFILFETKLKYVILGIIIINVLGALSLSGADNVDYFGHLGGAFFGWLYVYLLNRGTDLSDSFNYYYDKMVFFFQRTPMSSRRPQPTVVFKNNEKIRQKRQPNRQSDYSNVQDKIDAILDKINNHGIDSLTAEEQNFLHNHHNKLD